MFYWVAKNSKFPVDKWTFEKTNPHCSVALSKSNVFLLIYCEINKRQIYYDYCKWVVGLQESVNKRKIQFSRGFEKESITRAVCLQECPLA